MEFQVIDNFAGLFRQTVFLDQRHDSQFHRCQSSRQLQYHTCFAVFQLFFVISGTHHAQEHTVHTDRSFDDIRSIAFVDFRIEILDALAREFFVLAQVEIGTRMDTFHFLETERHQELDIGCCIGIVSQFFVVVETIVVIAKAQCLMPFQTSLFPFLEPFEFGSRFYEELHFHLFELTHTENELTGHDFVTESLTNLSDTERNLHTSCLLYVQVVHENTLSGFRTKINLHGTVGSRTHFGGKHQVELTHFCPVLCT